jgi:hypothetical protein
MAATYHLRSSSSKPWTREGNPFGLKRMKLVYKFAKHVIVTFQNSEADCVQPFLKPVDPKADGASNYYKVIRYPMDLTTMLQKLRDGKYREACDVKRSFDRMFANCFKYNSPGCDVYKKGVEFQRAFKRVWLRKDDWVEAQAAKSRRVTNEGIMDDSREQHTSDDEQTESSEESDEDSQEDDESSAEDFYPGHRRIVLDEDYLTDNNTSDDDRTEDSSESENDNSSDETYDEDSPPVKRRRVALHDLHPADDDTFKKHEHKGRARKKNGLKRHVAVDEIASDLNANHERSLDTTAGLETQASPQDQVVSTGQPPEAEKSAAPRQQPESVDVPAKKARLDTIFQDHFQDQLQVLAQRPQTEQPETDQQLSQEQQCQQPLQEPSSEHPTQQPHQQPKPKEKYFILLIPTPAPPLTHPPSPSTSPLNPLQAYLTELITKQLDTTTAQINSNVNGEFTEHLVLLSQLCNNERRKVFYQVWKTKAMEKVSQMQVQDILIRGVEKQVSLALAETVTEQTREYCEQVTSRATAFTSFLGGGDGKSSLD